VRLCAADRGSIVVDVSRHVLVVLTVSALATAGLTRIVRR
jgi:hypothetical protein